MIFAFGLRKPFLGVGLTILMLAVLPSQGTAQWCLACPPCYSTEEHQVTGNLVDWGVWAEYTHPCWGGTCSEVHLICFGDEDQEDFQADLKTLTALSSANLEDLRNILKKYPNRVMLNSERRAIQVLGCDNETLMAHVPLPEELVEALSEG